MLFGKVGASLITAIFGNWFCRKTLTIAGLTICLIGISIALLQIDLVFMGIGLFLAFSGV